MTMPLVITLLPLNISLGSHDNSHMTKQDGAESHPGLRSRFVKTEHKHACKAPSHRVL